MAYRPPLYRRKRCFLKTCGQLFRPKTKWQRFCCAEHKKQFHYKGDEYGRLEKDIVNLVHETIDARLSYIARKVFLMLEVEPPPALISRIVDQLRSSTPSQ